MRHTLTITEQAYERLTGMVFADPDCEGAAYLLCGTSITAEETRLLVRDVIPVAPEHYEVRDWDRLSIRSASYAAVAKQAGQTGDSPATASTAACRRRPFDRARAWRFASECAAGLG